jgi:hypothetical protein
VVYHDDLIEALSLILSLCVVPLSSGKNHEIEPAWSFNVEARVEVIKHNATGIVSTDSYVNWSLDWGHLVYSVSTKVSLLHLYVIYQAITHQTKLHPGSRPHKK